MRQRRTEMPFEPEWKDTDPPFMRAVWERDAPSEPPRLPWAENRKRDRRKNADKRRALKAGATVAPVDRAAIIKRDDSTCYLCGRRCDEQDIHIDHIVPLSRGGAHAEHNLAVACGPCNLVKGTGMTDKRPPALR